MNNTYVCVWAQNNIGPNADYPRPKTCAKVVGRRYGPWARKNPIWRGIGTAGSTEAETYLEKESGGK